MILNKMTMTRREVKFYQLRVLGYCEKIGLMRENLYRIHGTLLNNYFEMRDDVFLADYF